MARSKVVNHKRIIQELIPVKRSIFIVVFSCCCFTEAYGEVEEWSFSESDANIIKYADIDSASHVVAQLQRRVKHGTEPLRDAVPALVYRFIELERTPVEGRKQFGEAYGEFTFQVLSLLSKIGDPRSKEVLIEGMKYGPGATEGLLIIGPTVIPDLLEAMSSPRNEIKKGAMRALRGIYELDPSFFDQPSQNQIREDLMLLLVSEDGLVRRSSIWTLAVFGDASTVSVLENIAEHDTFTVTRKGQTIYSNRIEAQEAIERIKAKKRQIDCIYDL